MNKVKLSVVLLAALTVAACSSTPEKEAGATGAMNGASTSTAGIGAGGYDESALYAGKPTQANSVVYFDYDSFAVGEKYRAMLREHAAFLAANPKRQVTIEAHADERGSNEYNVALSEKRGNAVRDILVLQGAAAEQISVVAYGEEKPVCDQHNESCYAQNRRAELVYGSR
ncbi:MAG: peptidoglycan-associated lipoprotein Pal [Gammaproteobacteria bacterium]|nr:peptidoglycan-associated lipoprotein Pal [Gammaproteobacteria bacterium]